MEYIRKYYGSQLQSNVPAKRGGRVLYKGIAGTITGSDGHYLKIRLDGEVKAKKYHPTWKIEYLTDKTQ